MVSLRTSALVLLAACKHPSPLDTTRITIDGEWDEPQWNRDAKRGQFTDGDALARPYSEVRLLTDATFVYVGLYAADEDIRSDDRFSVNVGPLDLWFDATGKASDPRVRAAVDRDGTLDRSDDDDEEWVIEASIPRAALPPPPWHVRAARCDVTHAGHRHCGAWQGTLP